VRQREELLLNLPRPAAAAAAAEEEGWRVGVVEERRGAGYVSAALPHIWTHWPRLIPAPPSACPCGTWSTCRWCLCSARGDGGKRRGRKPRDTLWTLLGQKTLVLLSNQHHTRRPAGKGQ